VTKAGATARRRCTGNEKLTPKVYVQESKILGVRPGVEDPVRLRRRLRVRARAGPDDERTVRARARQEGATSLPARSRRPTPLHQLPAQRLRRRYAAVGKCNRGWTGSRWAWLTPPLRRRGPASCVSSIAHPERRQTDPQLEMSANAQRHGRPVEYRWRPLFNSAKFC